MCLLWPSISPHSLTSDTTDTNNVIVRARAPDSEGSPQNSAPAIFRSHHARVGDATICRATTRAPGAGAGQQLFASHLPTGALLVRERPRNGEA